MTACPGPVTGRPEVTVGAPSPPGTIPITLTLTFLPPESREVPMRRTIGSARVTPGAWATTGT